MRATTSLSSSTKDRVESPGDRGSRCLGATSVGRFEQAGITLRLLGYVLADGFNGYKAEHTPSDACST
jgi:hypothetical protein